MKFLAMLLVGGSFVWGFVHGNRFWNFPRVSRGEIIFFGDGILDSGNGTRRKPG